MWKIQNYWKESSEEWQKRFEIMTQMRDNLLKDIEITRIQLASVGIVLIVLIIAILVIVLR